VSGTGPVHRLGALGRRAAWELWYKAAGRPFDLPIDANIRIRCYPNSAEASALVRGGLDYDYHNTQFMRRYLRPGDAVLDIGANIGVYSLLAGELVGRAGRVDAFEPSPQMRRRLAENIALNRSSQVVVHPWLAAAVSGQARFADATTKSGRRRVPLPGELATTVVGVEAVRLDEVAGHLRYALMRLDVAGGEASALQGAMEMLRESNPPALLVALDQALADYGLSPERVAEWLLDQGYELVLYDADRHCLDYGASPWRTRRVVLAIARAGRNQVSQRLAGAPGEPD